MVENAILKKGDKSMKELPVSFWDPDFWAQEWERKEKTSLEKTVVMWNQRAKIFAQNTVGGKSQKRREELLGFLDFCGVQLDGSYILDIGCGPGNYALSFAQRADHVWALDPSAAMLEILRKKVQEEGVGNITCLEKSWEEINLTTENWEKKFDLVFAAMSPGINDRETLEKMMAACRGYCFLSKFARPRKNTMHEKLWKILFGTEFMDFSANFVYPVNLLWTAGYSPVIKMIKTGWLNEYPIPKAVQLLVGWLSDYKDVTPDMVRAVEEFCQVESSNGLVKEEVEAVVGMIAWKC